MFISKTKTHWHFSHSHSLERIPYIAYMNVIIIINFIIVTLLPQAQILKLFSSIQWEAKISENYKHLHTSLDENNENRMHIKSWFKLTVYKISRWKIFSRPSSKMNFLVTFLHFIARANFQLTFQSTSHRTWLRQFQICNFFASHSSMHVWIRECQRRCPIWSKNLGID